MLSAKFVAVLLVLASAPHAAGDCQCGEESNHVGDGNDCHACDCQMSDGGSNSAFTGGTSYSYGTGCKDAYDGHEVSDGCATSDYITCNPYSGSDTTKCCGAVPDLLTAENDVSGTCQGFPTRYDSRYDQLGYDSEKKGPSGECSLCKFGDNGYSAECASSAYVDNFDRCVGTVGECIPFGGGDTIQCCSVDTCGTHAQTCDDDDDCCTLECWNGTCCADANRCYDTCCTDCTSFRSENDKGTKSWRDYYCGGTWVGRDIL